MKRNVILLINADADTYLVTLTAAHTIGFDVQVAQVRHDLSEITDLALDDTGAIVLDYDPDVHGPAIGEQLRQWLPASPLILISSEYEHASMFQGTAARHLTKPATAAQIVHALDLILNAQPAETCDRWGHPGYEACVERMPETRTVWADAVVLTQLRRYLNHSN